MGKWWTFAFASRFQPPPFRALRNLFRARKSPPHHPTRVGRCPCAYVKGAEINCVPQDRMDRITWDFGMHDWSAETSTIWAVSPSYAMNSPVGKQFSVFMWRNHIPKLNSTFPSQVLVSSDKRPHRNLTFHNVSARQGSTYCNRARLNFQAFALRDMKSATREGYSVGQKMSYHCSFC